MRSEKGWDFDRAKESNRSLFHSCYVRFLLAYSLNDCECVENMEKEEEEEANSVSDT